MWASSSGHGYGGREPRVPLYGGREPRVPVYGGREPRVPLYGGREPRVLLYGLPSPGGHSGGPMLVDGLPFVVVVRMKLAVRAGHRLRRFVGLEALVQNALPRRTGGVAESL